MSSLQLQDAVITYGGEVTPDLHFQIEWRVHDDDGKAYAGIVFDPEDLLAIALRTQAAMAELIAWERAVPRLVTEGTTVEDIRAMMTRILDDVLRAMI